MRAGDVVRSRYNNKTCVIAVVIKQGFTPVWLVATDDLRALKKVDAWYVIEAADDRTFANTCVLVMQRLTQLAREKSVLADVLLHWALRNYIEEKPTEKVSLLQDWYEISELQKAVDSARHKLAARILSGL